MGNEYTDEINLGDGLIYGVKFLAIEKNKYVHHDEYLKIEKNWQSVPYLMVCKNLDL